MITCPKCGTGLTGSGKVVCPQCSYSFDSAPTATLMAPPAGGDLPAPPPKLGKYEILSTVARGGMGVIYKARQPALDRVVAIKVISPNFVNQPHFVERFFQEARTLAKLNHPNIVQIYDAEREGDEVFIVMEFVDGQSLRSVLRQRKLSPDEALKIIPPICDALDYAHGVGIIHRDIKPENILVTRRGEIKLTDFGLAVLRTPDGTNQRLTATDAVMGTVDYMAPEQRMGAKNVDHRADLYALGVVLYELLTGKLPIGRFDPPSMMGMDRRLDPVILRALEQEPAQRYQSASEIKSRLTRISTGATTMNGTAPTAPPVAPVPQPYAPPPPPPVYPMPPPPKRGMHPLLIVGLVLFGLMVLGCGGCAVLAMIGTAADAEYNQEY